MKSTIDEQGTENDYSVEYGKNITFPAKLYGSFLYPAGEYEAILITLGEGNGSNWWCVLFPPLCFLDFSGGTTVAEAADTDTVVEEEVEEEELKEEVKDHDFKQSDHLSKEALEEYLENIQNEINAIDAYKEPFKGRILSDEELGIPSAE